VIYGAHVVVFSTDADADRAFLGDALGLDAVDAGHGWLIFALPPAEVAVHPTEQPGVPFGFYLMCDDVEAEMRVLAALGVECEEPHDERWGRVTSFRLPGGAEVGLYQPSHPSPVGPAAP